MQTKKTIRVFNFKFDVFLRRTENLEQPNLNSKLKKNKLTFYWKTLNKI